MKAVLQVFSFDMLSKAILAVIGILLIRFMPSGQYAQYVFAMSLISLVTQAVTPAFNRMYIVGHKRLDLVDPASSFLGVQLTWIAIAVVVALPLAELVGLPVYGMAAAIVAATCFSETAKTVFQFDLRFMRFSLIAMSQAVLFFIGLAVIATLNAGGLSAWQVLALRAGTMLVVFSLMFGKSIRWDRLSDFTASWRITRGIVLGPYRFLFGYFLILSVFSQVDVLALKFLASDMELATYGSAFRYYGLLLMVLSALNVVLLPTVQKAETLASLKKVFRSHARLVYLFVPAVSVAAWLAGWVIPFIDNGRYPGAIQVFRVLCVAAVIAFALSPHINLVLRFEEFSFLFWLFAAGLALGAVLNVLLTPRLGALGAAFSTVSAQAVTNVAIYMRARLHMLEIAGASERLPQNEGAQ